MKKDKETATASTLSTAAFEPAATSSRLSAVRERVGEVDAIEAVGDATPTAETHAIQKYGPVFGDAARSAADVRGLCPDAFKGSTTNAATMRARAERIRERTAAREQVQALDRRLAWAIQADKQALAGEIDETVQIIEVHLENPTLPRTNPDLHHRLSTHAPALLNLIAGHRAAVQGRRMATKAKNERVSAGEADRDRLELEKRYLEGEELRPTDGSATPLAAKGRRRRPR